MSPLARALGAAFAALALLLVSSPGRADLVPSKLKYVLLDASFDSAVSGGDEKLLFDEEFALKGKPGCVLVRYSGELIGSDLDFSGHVSAVFKVFIGDVEVEPYPQLHEATTMILPQIVSFSAFACGVPPGPSGVRVTLRPDDPDDHVATIFRTLEVWTERPVLASSPISTGPAKGSVPPNLLKVKRTLLASTDETVTPRIDPVNVFHETVVLTGKRPSCLLVRYSGAVQGHDIDQNGFLSLNFRIRIGGLEPVHPNLMDLGPSEQPQIVTFSGFLCDLDPGEYTVDVEAESQDDDDPFDINSRVLEIFTENGRPAGPIE